MTNYSFLLFPIATVVLAAWLLSERITLNFVMGSILVLVGVWLGALTGSAENRSTAEGTRSAENVSRSKDYDLCF